MRGRQLKCAHLVSSDLLARLILSGVQDGFDPESTFRRGSANQVDHSLKTEQRSSPPVHADERKQAMLDLIPLAATRW